ncbi:hypothetical protein HGRIS_002977 [Hohenbuehelia grisea]|uniref:Uncharacterized protein n=1 Tax=Hohenbuehelia grisea TaxID=104357 RepID=A0ABR3JM38_9AGAR
MDDTHEDEDTVMDNPTGVAPGTVPTALLWKGPGGLNVGGTGVGATSVDGNGEPRTQLRMPLRVQPHLSPPRKFRPLRPGAAPQRGGGGGPARPTAGPRAPTSPMPMADGASGDPSDPSNDPSDLSGRLARMEAEIANLRLQVKGGRKSGTVSTGPFRRPHRPQNRTQESIDRNRHVRELLQECCQISTYFDHTMVENRHRSRQSDLYTRRIETSIALQVDGDHTWQEVEEILTLLQVKEMSSDESDNDNPHGRLSPARVRRRPYRSAALTRLLGDIDSLISTQNAYGNIRAGGTPHARNRYSALESGKFPSPELPRNFFCEKWLEERSAKEKTQLSLQPSRHIPDLSPFFQRVPRD